jgi:molybdate transport system substrate-binding protein
VVRLRFTDSERDRTVGQFGPRAAAGHDRRYGTARPSGLAFGYAGLVRIWMLIGLLFVAACGPDTAETGPPNVLVAASANLDRAIPQLMEAFEAETGVQAVVSLGSTSNLTQQIENGAPFDVFLSADASHIDGLIASRIANAESRRVYARGRLVLWTVADSPLEITGPDVLLAPGVRFISIANPQFAPYGIAAYEALERLGYAERLKDKLVYGQSISMAHQYAASGNADIAITALSLAIDAGGKWVELDLALYSPIEQTLAVLSNAPHEQPARAFAEFLLGVEAQAILEKFGYAAGD